MRQKSGRHRATAEQVVKDIRRPTRKHYSAEEKIRIVLEGLRGEGKLFSPQRSARCLLNMLDSLSPEQSGQVFAWDGQRIPGLIDGRAA